MARAAQPIAATELAPCNAFPDLDLPDHTGRRRALSSRSGSRLPLGYRISFRSMKRTASRQEMSPKPTRNARCPSVAQPQVPKTTSRTS